MSGTRTLAVSAAPINSRRMGTSLSTLEGDNIERRSDPRLFRLARDMVRCAVIFDVVALHESSLDPVNLRYRSLALYS